nr:MAG TPA: hypothetical protein [Bacteriophage sp.]
MATTKKAASEPDTAAVEGVKVADEPKFALEALQKHCLELFGVSTATFAGATAGIEAKEYTKNEIKSIIKEWCGQEAK